VAVRPHLSDAQMEQLVPIKMQHAAADFVTMYLAVANNGWVGEETKVGGEDDRRGVDFHLKHAADKKDIEVDFSTSSKGGFAVKLAVNGSNNRTTAALSFSNAMHRPSSGPSCRQWIHKTRSA